MREQITVIIAILKETKDYLTVTQIYILLIFDVKNEIFNAFSCS